MRHDADYAELAAISASDAWLDEVSRGQPRTADPLAESLTEWLHGLDIEYQPSALPTPRRRSRTGRSAVAAAAAIALLAGAGTAAATPGNPLHRVLFGHQAPASTRSNNTLNLVGKLLDAAERLIGNGQSIGYLAGPDRAAAIGLLRQARTQLDTLPATPDRAALAARQALLALQIAQLPASRPAPAWPSSATPGRSRPADAGNPPMPSTSAQGPADNAIDSNPSGDTRSSGAAGDTGQHDPSEPPTNPASSNPQDNGPTTPSDSPTPPQTPSDGSSPDEPAGGSSP